jgi:hypothetical protein
MAHGSRASTPDSTSVETKFRAKGLVFLGAREFYAAHVPGGWDGVLSQLSPEGAAFFTQTFLSGNWYDVMPILPLSAAAARASGKLQSRLVRENAEWLARRDLRGIYRLIVAVASVEMVAQKLPDLSLRYFDFGRAEGKMVGEKVFESNRFGIPAPLAEWFAAATSGFVPVALGSAGAKSVQVRASPPAPDGHAHGVALVKTRFEISWE